MGAPTGQAGAFCREPGRAEGTPAGGKGFTRVAAVVQVCARPLPASGVLALLIGMSVNLCSAARAPVLQQHLWGWTAPPQLRG